MSPQFTYKSLSIIGLAAAFLVAGCHGNQSQTSNASDQSASGQTSQSAQQDQPDSSPDTANLVPVADNNQPAPSGQLSSSPSGESSGSYDDSADESDYGVQPEATAPQPPPPLPDYSQPECPGDGYEWTPGYWNYASAGYYWVPGAWVQAPYSGALWTPGYWGWTHNHYGYFHGYWGPHIGFYGGVDYGFGYTGVGYQGGYWNGGRFNYNRSVNNIDVTVVHNVYNRTIVHNTTIVNRVSFNGGSGGIQVRPRPAELAALREPHAGPMQTQIAIRQSASTNRAQFASVNHGRPAVFVNEHPVAAERNVTPVVSRSIRNLPAAARPVEQVRENPAPAGHPEVVHPEADRPTPSRPETVHPEVNRSQPVRPETTNRPEPGRPEPNRVEPNRAEPARPAPAQREVNHAEPARPAPGHPAAEHKPKPDERKESHPQF